MLQITDTFICSVASARSMVSILFRGIPLGSRRTGTGPGERDGQDYSQQLIEPEDVSIASS